MILYLFDIDGTLLLAGGAGSRAINTIFRRRYGLQEAMRDVNPAGNTDPLIFTEIFEQRLHRAPKVGEIDELLEEYVPLLERELGASPRFRTMPSAVSVVSYLADRPEVTLGIATGNVRGAARAKLAHIDLWTRFELGGYGCDSAERSELVARAIERANSADGASRDSPKFAPERVIVVGDTPKDIAAAQACGTQVIAVATGSVSRAELAAAGPDEVFDTLAELPAWHARRIAA